MRPAVSAVSLFMAALLSSAASAGVYTDDLTKCLVKSSSADDQILLVQWIFSAFALNPAVAPLSSISAEQREEINKRTAALTERLLTVDCHKESVAAIKYEGITAISSGFQALGEVASRGLMNDPKVAAGMGDLDKYYDNGKLNELGQEAGVPAPAAPAK